jgi:hypothetical protein
LSPLWTLRRTMPNSSLGHEEIFIQRDQSISIKWRKKS